MNVETNLSRLSQHNRTIGEFAKVYSSDDFDAGTAPRRTPVRKCATAQHIGDMVSAFGGTILDNAARPV